MHHSLEGEDFWPNTITYAIFTRMRYNSYQELVEPLPEEFYDHPVAVKRHLDKIYPHRKQKSLDVPVQIDEVEE